MPATELEPGVISVQMKDVGSDRGECAVGIDHGNAEGAAIFDPSPIGRAGLDCDRPNGYAPRHEWIGPAGSGGSPTRSTRRRFFLCSATAAATTRHSTYSLRHSTIAYRWHPLAGQTLQVSPHRRGKDLTCIYTAECPGFSRELPNWMLDQIYCGGMTLGAPQISVEGLTELGSKPNKALDESTNH
jgi:hypothetical protein